MDIITSQEQKTRCFILLLTKLILLAMFVGKSKISIKNILQHGKIKLSGKYTL